MCPAHSNRMAPWNWILLRLWRQGAWWSLFDPPCRRLLPRRAKGGGKLRSVVGKNRQPEATSHLLVNRSTPTSMPCETNGKRGLEGLKQFMKPRGDPRRREEEGMTPIQSPLPI